MKPIMCAVGTSGTHANANHQRLPNAYETASWWSRLLFTWPYPLLQLGLQRPLQDADLPELQDVDRSVNCRHYFERIWELKQVRKDNHHSLQRAILFDFWKTVWYAHPIMCVAAIAKVTQAVVLGKLVQSFQQETTTTTTSGYVWAGALVVCGLITLLEHHHLFFWTWRYGMQIRTSVVATIYQKSTRLHSVFSTHDVPYGKIMNLASNDSERFLMAALFCNYIIWAPIQSIAILIVGVFTIGYAFAVGFGILLGIFIPLQVYLGGRFAYHRSKIAASTDARVQFVGQAIRGARLMKMSGYEHLFWKRIMELRKIETAKIRRANTLKSYNEALFFATNVVISIIIFIVHVKVAGRELQSGDVFTVFTLINILQMEMTKHVSLAVMAVSECYVSIARIQKFLELPELDQKQQQYAYCQENNNNEDGNSDNGHPRNSSSLPNGACLVMEHVTCYWNNVEKSATTRTSKSIQIHPEDSVSSIGDGEKSKSNDDDEELSTASSMTAATNVVALQDVTVDFQPRQLTAIVGTVGGGKSALLQALVGELPVTSGRIVRNRSLAYAAQDSWIMDGTVRDNILMGLEYNQTWYYEVVTACGLLVDFAQFSRSDQTILGDRGVQCSGGQKARIALARAIYRDADILVVDDPLSAVDAKVGRQLYEQALQRLGVQRGKCVIVATHQHQYLRNDENARCVLVENGGKVTCIGSYEECIETSKGTLIAHQSADDIVDGLVATEEENDAIFAAVLKAEDVCLDEDGFDEDDPDKQNDRPCNKDKEDHREMKQEGKVEMDTYKNYLGAMGGLWIGVFLALLFSITQGSVLVTIAIVGRWAQRPVEDQDDWDMIGLVMGLGCLVIVLALFRALICFHFTIKASQTLHDRMTKA
jgi:ATP-binding cassette subfamily C (CFTR/MRP) protein 4